jgi:hypothetical protein
MVEQTTTMVTYTLTVDIGEDVYATLKKGGYKLCICKKIKDEYNVVWEGNTFLPVGNKFEWTEDFSVFGATQFKNKVQVGGATRDQRIKFGQTCVLSDIGVMGPATGPVKGGTFTVDNEYVSGTLHIGVKQKIGSGTALPVYVSPVVVTGIDDFTPVVTVMVFFNRELKTSTMFDKSVSHTCEVEYEGGATSQTRLYNDDQEWEIEGKALPKLGYRADKGFYHEDIPLEVNPIEDNATE